MRKKSKPTPIEKFLALSDAQKDAAVAKYDQPMPVAADGLPGKPITAAQRARFRKRKAGRPRVGQGAKIVPVTIERGLLKQVDAFAKQHGLKRSQMVADGLLRILGEGKARRAG